MMTYVREHDLANAHPLCVNAIKKADRAVAASRKAMLAREESGNDRS